MAALGTAFKFTALACFVVVAVVIGWLIYGERSVSEASQFRESIEMVDYQTGGVSNPIGNTGHLVERNIAEITDVAELIAEWTPRYQATKEAFKKFDLAIVAAEEQAELYFQSQSDLTAQLNDHDLRIRAQARDDAYEKQFLEWQVLAHHVRSQARTIILRLDDMDIELKKLELLSEMSFDAMGFREVPDEITALDLELEQFKAASENIRQLTESPFEMKP